MAILRNISLTLNLSMSLLSSAVSFSTYAAIDPVTAFISEIRRYESVSGSRNEVDYDACPIIKTEYDIDNNGELDLLLSSGCREDQPWEVRIAGRKWHVFMQIDNKWFSRKSLTQITGSAPFELDPSLTLQIQESVKVSCPLQEIESESCKWAHVPNDYRGLYQQRLRFEIPESVKKTDEELTLYSNENPLISKVIKKAGIDIERVHLRFSSVKKISVNDIDYHVVVIPVIAYGELYDEGVWASGSFEVFDLDSFIFIVNSDSEVLGSYFESFEVNDWNHGGGNLLSDIELNIEDLELKTESTTFTLTVRASSGSKANPADRVTQSFFVLKNNQISKVLRDFVSHNLHGDVSSFVDCYIADSMESTRTLTALKSKTNDFYDLNLKIVTKFMLHRDARKADLPSDFSIDKEKSDGECVKFSKTETENATMKNTNGLYHIVSK